ncbi:Zinc/iron permease [Penicillium alfredii]|uniref:Zinc/iron permease n=1 Tax=Penicillium alfredii TaxID=1506179 RepID=A0A9W9FJZ8_9EURO|nr:Zinc/iron permease [Penicillium alfredii]KAJ5101560.1 Zinc/iron permease [Penicillium alfredii]
MNCPSRTDDTLLHDEWNQNPPCLSADLTTRQDLNGIANARENNVCENGLARLGLSQGCTHWTSIPPLGRLHGEYPAADQGASLTQSGRPIPRKTDFHVGPPGRYPNDRSILPSYQTVKNWGLWLLSVLCVSALISHDSLGRYLNSQSLPVRPTYDIPGPKVAARSTCAQGGVRGDAYNLPLHIAALFIILGVSTFACAFPILAIWFPRLRIPTGFLFFVSHFGTGVLIATAFVHLLPTAFTSLGDPCLSSFWTKDYPAMPGAIALGGIFLVTLIEMVFSPARNLCRGGNRSSPPESSPPYLETRDAAPPPRIDLSSHSDHARNPSSHVAGLDAGSHLRDMGPLIGRSSSMIRAINRMGEGSEEITRIESAPDIPTDHEKQIESIPRNLELGEDNFTLTPQQKQQKEVMQVYLLEMGILFHSVFIGMSLSVSVGNEFVVLLIAIVFHQTFEGLALGSRIAALPWSDKQIQPWIMSLAYGCTTPIGQAIGLATHTLYSPDSEVGLLLVGTMNAISSGLLIFASLVELMSEDFLSDESWRILRGRKRVYACILVFLGAFCMSIVGAWA